MKNGNAEKGIAEFAEKTVNSTRPGASGAYAHRRRGKRRISGAEY
jgi:hypothetical protein